MRLAALLACGLAVWPGAQQAPAQQSSAAYADAVRPAPSDVGWSDTALSADLPPGFQDLTLVADWNQAVGLEFAADGRLFVWEKAGLVWVVEDGVKESEPLLDLSEEVGNWGDHGLLGFALHPDFTVNGFIFLLYVVDYHHLANSGTPAYDPDVSEDWRDTIARVVRYTVVEGGGAHHSVDPASRRVLIGEDINDGIPVCGVSHGAGALEFGTDLSLLVAVGDSAIFSVTETCLADGILRPEEDIGPFRAQMATSMSGKILRINPGSGNGIRTNPFYNELEPDSTLSRLWASGVRNPFRMELRPGTGSTSVLDGDPGTLFVGDVGDVSWEEISIVRAGGANLGWPLYEGLVLHDTHAGLIVDNQDAPNPLFDGRGCADEFFSFQSLLVEDTQNVPSWPNPCNPAFEVPPEVPHYVHTRPLVVWSHTDGTAQIPVFDGFGEAQALGIDDPASPVAGESFNGRCAVVGTWFDGDDFPAPFQDGLFTADFNSRWIRFFQFDRNDNLIAVEPLSPFAGAIVDMAAHPADGSLYYINYNDLGVATVHRVSYEPDNQSPVAAAVAAPSWGPAPLRVQLDGSPSFDPEGTPLTYRWDLGPGLPESAEAAPRLWLPAEDVSAIGVIISRLDELDPPESMGFGVGPEVIRDGLYPPVGDLVYSGQFDTTHVDQDLVPDKGGEDWVGYEYTEPRTFSGLVYQEGINNQSAGGWFEDMTVQVRSGGVWSEVTGLSVVPAYPGSLALNYERFDLLFDPTAGDAIRLFGTPGGSFEFISVGELRVLAVPALSGPTAWPLTLEVTDAVGVTATADVTVSLGNSPPLVSIVSPAAGGSYPVGPSGSATLVADVWDAEHGPAELTYAWQVKLHHNDHIHPGPILTDVSPEANLAGHGCDGDIHFTSVQLTVTDGAGLATTETVYLSPDCDCDMNGEDDAVDLGSGPLLDQDGNGVLDACEVDCNANGLPDPYEVFFGLVRDRNGNGVPDPCDPVGQPIPGQPGSKTLLNDPVPTAQPGS